MWGGGSGDLVIHPLKDIQHFKGTVLRCFNKLNGL